MKFLHLVRLCLVALPVLASGIAQAKDCKLEQVADLPVSWIDGNPIISISIAGAPARMLLDTGSQVSLLTDRAFEQMDLTGSVNAGGSQILTGSYRNFLGSTEQVDDATMQAVKIGHATVRDQVLILLRKIGGGSGPQQVDGVLGFDALENFDIALDLGHGRIQLYALERCDTPQYPWKGLYAPVPLSHYDGVMPKLQVGVDGQALNMILDTGAARGELPARELAQAGIKAEAVAASSSVFTDAVGHELRIQHEQFATFDVGGEEFQNAWIDVNQTVQTATDTPFIGTLGEDYLTTHKVFISNSTEQVLLGVSNQ